MGERKIYRRIPMEGDYQTLTMDDGERFYVRYRNGNNEVMDEGSKKQRYSGLCGEPYSLLLEQAIAEQIRIQDSISSMTNTMEMTSEDSGVESSATSSEDESPSVHLWVEKFKPKSYSQLLSDDGTNRILLKWLKLWDKVVFGKDIAKVRFEMNIDR